MQNLIKNENTRKRKLSILSVVTIVCIVVLYQHNLSSYMYRQQSPVETIAKPPATKPLVTKHPVIPTTPKPQSKKTPKPPTSRAIPETPETRGIPKIIHQVWSDEIIPTDFVDHIKKLVELNPPPEWKYCFWTQKSGRKLIERKYPSLLTFYNISGNVQKANIIRVLAIHHFGGAYFDLDTVAVKPLAPYFDNETCSLTPEPPEHYIHKDSITRPEFISNNVLLCKPRHPFYDLLIRQLEKQPHKCLSSNKCSGPTFVSHVFTESRKKKENFDILPKFESYELFQDKIAKECMNNPSRVCNGNNYETAEVWRREMCDEWRSRGGSGRGISKWAYTYHTWYHFLTHKTIKTDPKIVISNIVPHVLMYE